jgi:hypothetical protein
MFIEAGGESKVDLCVASGVSKVEVCTVSKDVSCVVSKAEVCAGSKVAACDWDCSGLVLEDSEPDVEVPKVELPMVLAEMVFVDGSNAFPDIKPSPLFLTGSMPMSVPTPAPMSRSLALVFLGLGFFGALFVPIEITGFVGIMTTVSLLEDAVVTVGGWMLDSGRGVRMARDGNTITGLGLTCVAPSLRPFSRPVRSSSLAMRSAREVLFIDPEEGDDFIDSLVDNEEVVVVESVTLAGPAFRMEGFIEDSRLELP